MQQETDKLQIEDPRQDKIPSNLNILTILTFIGSAFTAIGLFSNLMQNCDDALAQIEELPEMGGFMDKMLEFSASQVEVLCANKMLILTAGFISVILCIYGAVLMRKLKKQGFMLYSIGELLSPTLMLILTFSSSLLVALSGFIVPVIFIALYATQRKYFVD